MYLRFTEAFLSAPFSPQVRLFILPALKRTAFSYMDWLQALREATATESPCWLLYSMLYLGSNFSSKLGKCAPFSVLT